MQITALRTNLLPLGIAVLLLTSSVPMSLAASPGGTDWTSPDGNGPLNWNYSGQSLINQSNSASLQSSWTFPIPSAPPPYVGAEGAMVTPLVVKGILYTVTNWHRVYAIDASNGIVLWYTDLPLWSNYSKYLQPSIPGPLGLPLGHYHEMVYTSHIRGRALVWVISNSYQVFALDALSGRVILTFDPMRGDLAGGVPGNFGLYDVNTPTILVDDSRGILMFSPSVSEGAAAGRGFISGWNVSSGTPEELWRTFLIPPQDGSDGDWSLGTVQNMTHAYIFNGTSAIDLKTLSPQRLGEILGGDWGTFGFNGTTSFAGASAAWGGSWAIDASTGTAFVSTNVPGPDWNATFRPGPNLWSASVLSLNESTGSIKWAFQAMPHALGDFDCSWNVVLANSTVYGVNQKVVYKGCKSGYIFALSASTGSLLWYLKPPTVKYANSIYLDPLNQTEMTRFNWIGYPSTSVLLENPSDTGSLESDLSYDPVRNLIVAVPYNDPKLFTPVDVPPLPGRPANLTQWEFGWGTNILGIRPLNMANSTVIGIDSRTGKAKWSYFIPNEPFRGGTTVSGGVVYVTTLDGMLRVLNADDGTLIASRNIGGSIPSQPSLGEDSSGRVTLFLTDMGSTRWGPAFPGFIQALTLPPSQPTAGNYLVPTLGGVAVVEGGLVLYLLLRGRLRINRQGKSGGQA